MMWLWKVLHRNWLRHPIVGCRVIVSKLVVPITIVSDKIMKKNMIPNGNPLWNCTSSFKFRHHMTLLNFSILTLRKSTCLPWLHSTYPLPCTTLYRPPSLATVNMLTTIYDLPPIFAAPIIDSPHIFGHDAHASDIGLNDEVFFFIQLSWQLTNTFIWFLDFPLSTTHTCYQLTVLVSGFPSSVSTRHP